jgi:hypothetical protein
MKKSEIVILLIGTIATFVFVGYMFDYYLRIEEAQLMRQNIFYDSVLIEQQKQLKKKDSILQDLIKKEDEKLNNKVSIHHRDIQKIYRHIDSLKEK